MKRILLLTASSGLLYLSLTSASFGPGSQALNCTGSPGSTSTCSSCHGGGSGTTIANAEIRKLSTGISGPIVSQYQHDTTYIVKVVGNNINLSHFGFQLTALNTSNTNAGTFQNVTGSMHIVAVGSKNIVEHTAPLAKTNSQYEATFQWKAPSTGTGNITFYGVINGVDNGGNATADKPSNPFTVILAQAPTSVNELQLTAELTAYPNPFGSVLNIKMDNAANGVYTMAAFDINGKKVLSNAVTVSGKTYETSINTGNWAAGLYHIQLSKDGATKTIMVTKN